MNRCRMSYTVFVIFVGMASVRGQDTTLQSHRPPAAASVIALTLPSGTPLQIALDKEVRVRKVEQAIEGRLVQPVYAFDHLVIPVGTEVTGHISKISSIAGTKRALGILNIDLTPTHPLEVEFDDLVFTDGRHMRLHTSVTPGSGQVMRLASAGEHEKRSMVKTAASQKMEAARREWYSAMKQVREPGRMHRVLRYGLAELPLHPQYLDAGTLYFAELEEPLAFGSEALTPRNASALGTLPPPGSLVHALLITPLNSATTLKGAEVEALISRPLFDGDHLILPQGSRLRGSVLQVRPARYWHRNGQLRIAFRELVLPEGTVQRVATSLEGLQSGAEDHAQLDTEGGARATSSKSRYASTGLAVGLALTGPGGKRDVGEAGPVAGGATAVKLPGIILGLFVRSHSLAIVMSAFGGSRSIYANFLGRGRNIVFPKNTVMEIGFGNRSALPVPVASKTVSSFRFTMPLLPAMRPNPAPDQPTEAQGTEDRGRECLTTPSSSWPGWQMTPRP